MAAARHKNFRYTRELLDASRVQERATFSICIFPEPRMTRIRLFSVALLPLLTVAAATAPTPPIKELQNITPNEAAYKSSSATKPLLLKTEKDAAAYFTADELAKLTRQVDFNSQIVLLFAWQGSGQDKLDYSVAESYPEQIRFTHTPGRTKDLRQQVHIYALRANVVWSAK
jgi:hypothetical protein